MKLTSSHVKVAHILAAESHKGQLYGEEDYYLYHLCGVLNKYKVMYPRHTPCEEVAVLLHDIVEDTSATLKDVEEIFGNKVAGIVDSMTRRSDESYNHYIVRLMRNPSAVKVKKADSSFNLEQSIKDCRESGIIKYRKVLDTLG